MSETKITVAETKSVFSINIGNKAFCLLTRVRVFADSAASVSYCLFTIITNKDKNYELR